MKKFKHLFIALAAMLLAVPDLHAQKYVIGSVMDISEAADGVEVVFEGRTDNTNKEGYLGMPNGATPLVRFTGDEVPEDIVWVLCAVDSLNPVTGDPMFNLKNKATGEYIGSDWSQTSNQRLFAVTDQADAAPFCFKYANSGDTYGGVNSGSFDSGDWLQDPSTLTICEIDASITNGRGFIANESNENTCGFYEWQDTNIWSMHRYVQLTSGRDYLNEFLNNLSPDWQTTYQVGTDPGYVNDSEKWNRFFNLWSNALDNIDNMSDDECMAAYNELDALYKWLQSSESQVQVEDGGYYYFFTANTAFTDVDNGNFAIYAPNQSQKNILGWKAFDENDPAFIWQVKQARVGEDGTVYYSVQNMGSRLYIGQATSKADSQPIEWTDEYAYPTLFISLDHAGQWQLSDRRDWTEYPPRPFHQENHQNGAGTAGQIVLYNGGLGTASSWYIKKVPQEKVDMLASQENRINLANLWAHNGKLATNVGDSISDVPGFISSKEILDNYRKADADADTMLHYSDKAYTEEEYGAAYEALKSASEAFIADRDRGLADGYYRIKLQQAVYKYNDPDMYLNIVNGRPGWSRESQGVSLSQVWKIQKIDGVQYNVQNMGNGKYLHKGDTNSNGAYINFSDAPDVAQVIRPFDVMNGQFYITNADDTDYFYDSGDHDNGTASSSALKYWTGHDIDGGTAWVFEPVTDEEYAAIEAADAQTTLNYELESSLATAKRLYNQNTTYTYGEKLITDVSQIYSNNSSVNEGQHLENMIDGTNGTYWNSAWDTETENATHYLRFESSDAAGWPDSVAFYFEERNDNTWHRAPTKMRVSVSNDAEEWNEVKPVLEQGDITSRDFNTHSTDPVYVMLNDIKGYKYVRFEFLACKPDYRFNNHPIVEFSEANILPVTGVDEDNSLTCTPKYKVIANELFNAIQAGQKEYNDGTATQATIDLLDKAIAGFNNVSVADSIIAMSNLNLMNFTSGDMIGDFPSDALDTYTEEAYDALDKYNEAEVKTAEVTNDVVSELKAAYDKLYPQMVKPEEGKWYVLKSMNPDVQDWILAAGGPYAYAPNSGNYSYVLSLAGLGEDISNIGSETYAHYTFKENEDGTWTIQCAGTGYFFGPETGSGNTKYDNTLIQWYEPNPVTLIPFGNGQVGFRMSSGRYITGGTALGAIGSLYESNDGTQGMNTKYAWMPATSAEDYGLTEVYQYESIKAGRVIAMTFPFTIAGMPVETQSGDLIKGYELIGKQTAENSNDSIVTAYYLRELDPYTEVPAGTPVVYVGPGDKYDATVSYTAQFSAVVDGAITCEGDTVNGLAGSIQNFATPIEHMGYFLEDSVVDEPAGTAIGYWRAVILPWEVENVADAEPDLIVYVKGAGMLNDIKDVVIEDQAEKVDVYSTDGVLIRRNVARANATDGLAKGIYIVGKEKVLVK